MKKEEFMKASDEAKYQWWNRQRQLLAVYQLVLSEVMGQDRAIEAEHRLRREFDRQGDDYSDLHKI